MLEYLLFFTAFLMEAIGSYVSIVGLGSLFAGNLVIVGMVLCLDVSKIVSVSFLYQYWQDLPKTMKYYMFVAVLVLMTITSTGTFGYLSGEFQKAMQPNVEATLKVESLKREQDTLVQEKARLVVEKEKIDQQIAQLPTNSVRGRKQLIESFRPDQERIAARMNVVTKRVDELTSEILRSESANIEQNVHVGPIMYISKAFDVSVEDASKWIILVIISVFDPLAIMMIVGGNFLIVLKRTKREKNIEIQKVEAPTIQESEPVPEPIQDPAVLIEPELIDELPIKEAEVTEPVREIDPDLGEVEYVSVEEIKDAFPTVPWSEPEQEAQPVIEVAQDFGDVSSPQVELINESPTVSSLEQLNIRIPQALVKEGVFTESKKRHLYE